VQKVTLKKVGSHGEGKVVINQGRQSTVCLKIHTIRNEIISKVQLHLKCNNL